MTLVTDWQKILRKAWSVKFNILAIVLGSAEALLPLFEDTVPRGVFGGLSALAAGGALAARIMSQKEFGDEDQQS